MTTYSYPRAALIGNPSDGYHGRTIAFTFSNFRAEVILEESKHLTIEPSERDAWQWDNLAHLDRDIAAYGYYGGLRLFKAALRRFYNYCRTNSLPLRDDNFTLRYRSNIPNLVGMAGSSALVTACFRSLEKFYGVSIPSPLLANEIRAVENTDLNIGAGLQDRVIQVYQGLVYMDFDRRFFEERNYGDYIPLDLPLSHIYIAYRTDFSEGSEVFHNDLRSRYDAGDAEVHAAMHKWAELTNLAREAMQAGDITELGRLMDENFDLRARLCRLSEGNLKMVATARACGASAKFTGSGGAIIGTYPDETVYARLTEALGALNIRVFKPDLV